MARWEVITHQICNMWRRLAEPAQPQLLYGTPLTTRKRWLADKILTAERAASHRLTLPQSTFAHSSSETSPDLPVSERIFLCEREKEEFCSKNSMELF